MTWLEANGGGKGGTLQEANDSGEGAGHTVGSSGLTDWGRQGPSGFGFR